MKESRGERGHGSADGARTLTTLVAAFFLDLPWTIFLVGGRAVISRLLRLVRFIGGSESEAGGERDLRLLDPEAHPEAGVGTLFDDRADLPGLNALELAILSMTNCCERVQRTVLIEKSLGRRE